LPFFVTLVPKPFLVSFLLTQEIGLEISNQEAINLENIKIPTPSTPNIFLQQYKMKENHVDYHTYYKEK